MQTDTRQPASSPSLPLVKRNAGLDILRAVAILLVIGRHLVPHLTLSPDGWAPLQWAINVWHSIGWLGVDLFFVLSGFLISGLLFNEYKKLKSIDLSRFLLRRGLKIYPAYYAFLVYGVLSAGLKLYTQNHSFSLTFSEINNYWPCLILVQNYAQEHYPWGHTWSLAVEEHFYLLFSISLIWLISKWRNWHRPFLGLSILVIVSCLIFRIIAIYVSVKPGHIYCQTQYRIDALLIGVLLRYVFSFTKFLSILERIPTLLLVVAGLIPWILASMVEWDNPWVLGIGLTIFPISAAAIIMIVQKHPINETSHPTTRLLTWIGRNSYCTYLWHVTIIGWSFQLVGKLGLAHSGDFSILMLVTTTVTLCLCFGSLITWAIETPILHLRDRWLPSH